MSSPQNPQASANNLQTRRLPGGITSSAWQTGARVALFGMIVNSIFAVAKILGGVFGHAYVLIADGIESGLDIAGSFVIWSGLKVAARPPDASHPYGHGKAEPIAAVIVGAGVLAAAVGLAIQSMREIFLPHHTPAPYTLGILIVVIVIKENVVSLCEPDWTRRGEYSRANRCLAPSQRRAHVRGCIRRDFGSSDRW